MGNQTSASKQKDLYKQVNNSNPILMDNMKSSRPCKIKEGKIFLYIIIKIYLKIK